MSSVPRAWPGVTVPADYYAGEAIAAVARTPGERTVQPVTLTHTARRPHHRLNTAWVALGFAFFATAWVKVPMLHSTLMLAFMLVGSRSGRRDVLISETSAGLVVARTGHQPDAAVVQPLDLVCLRPRGASRRRRLVRPELWRLGHETIVVDAPQLHDLLVRHSEASPS